MYVDMRVLFPPPFFFFFFFCFVPDRRPGRDDGGLFRRPAYIPRYLRSGGGSDMAWHGVAWRGVA